VPKAFCNKTYFSFTLIPRHFNVYTLKKQRFNLQELDMTLIMSPRC